MDLSELGPNANEMLAQVEHIQIVACRTSYNSGMVSRYWFEALAGVPCDVEIASGIPLSQVRSASAIA